MQSVKCLMVYFCRFLVFLFGLNVKSEVCVCVYVCARKPDINDKQTSVLFFISTSSELVKSFLPKRAANQRFRCM